MTIYRPIITQDGHKRFSNIPASYYACGWIEGETVAKSITNQDEAIEPPTYPNAPAIMDGIAVLESEGFEAFMQAVEDEGITVPDQVLNNDEQ